MGKKFWLSVFVTFVLLYALEFILHVFILSGFYMAHPDGFLREEVMAQRFYWMPVGFLIWAYLWVYFFNRFASEKTVFRGFQHGVAYMIFLNVPKSFIWYASIDISGYSYLYWTIGEVIIGAILGALMGLMMQEKDKAEQV